MLGITKKSACGNLIEAVGVARMSGYELVWKREMIMLNCKQNTEPLSQSLDRPSTFREKLAMRMHLMVCHGRRNFKKQLTFIRKAARELPNKW